MEKKVYKTLGIYVIDCKVNRSYDIEFTIILGYDFRSEYELFIRNIYKEVLKKTSAWVYITSLDAVETVNDVLYYSSMYERTLKITFPIGYNLEEQIFGKVFQEFIRNLWKLLEPIEGFFNAFVTMIKRMRDDYSNSFIKLNGANAIIVYECEKHVLSNYFEGLDLLFETENL